MTKTTKLKGAASATAPLDLPDDERDDALADLSATVEGYAACMAEAFDVLTLTLTHAEAVLGSLDHNNPKNRAEEVNPMLGLVLGMLSSCTVSCAALLSQPLRGLPPSHPDVAAFERLIEGHAPLLTKLMLRMDPSGGMAPARLLESVRLRNRTAPPPAQP